MPGNTYHAGACPVEEKTLWVHPQGHESSIGWFLEKWKQTVNTLLPNYRVLLIPVCIVPSMCQILDKVTDVKIGLCPKQLAIATSLND